ncbi:MAG: 6-carboxytetrahydropterin synthase [Candidatus Thorarchaeota archaeon]|nr:6-carboxytetrahydropterin synthase [Candidatus Thorarchaeota archaeon]
MSFSSAHFVISGGECEALHGHNYSVEVIMKGVLDELGMIVDFRDVKEEVAKVCKVFDHKVLLPGFSSSIKVEEDGESVHVSVEEKKYQFPLIDCVILPIRSTTAEHLAQYLSTQIEFPENLEVTVCVSESYGSSGCYTDEK